MITFEGPQCENVINVFYSILGNEGTLLDGKLSIFGGKAPTHFNGNARVLGTFGPALPPFLSEQKRSF